MPDKTPETERRGGPGASHENRKQPEKSRPHTHRSDDHPEQNADNREIISQDKAQPTPNTKGDAPKHQGGDSARKVQEWGGGNKASKGPITEADRQNENSSAKS